MSPIHRLSLSRRSGRAAGPIRFCDGPIFGVGGRLRLFPSAFWLGRVCVWEPFLPSDGRGAEGFTFPSEFRTAAAPRCPCPSGGLCHPRAPPGVHAAPARLATGTSCIVRTAPSDWAPASQSTRGGSRTHQMWGSVETTVKLAFTGLAGFTLACVVIETAGTAIGSTVAGSSESQNYFVTRTVVELLLAARKSTSASGRSGGIIYYSGRLDAARECLASSHEAS